MEHTSELYCVSCLNSIQVGERKRSLKLSFWWACLNCSEYPHMHARTRNTHTHKNPLAASNSVEGVHNLGTQMGQLQISTSRGGTATYSGQPQHTTQYHISTAHGTQYAHQTPTGWTIQHTPIVQQVKCCGTLECRLCTPDFSVMEMNFGNPFFKPVGQNLEQKAWNQGCQH